MKTIVRNTADLNRDDRTLPERFLGEQLHDDQRLVIGVIDRQRRRELLDVVNLSTADVPTLPDWCNVYEGLSDEEIADLELVILRRADLNLRS